MPVVTRSEVSVARPTRPGRGVFVAGLGLALALGGFGLSRVGPALFPTSSSDALSPTAPPAPAATAPQQSAAARPPQPRLIRNVRTFASVQVVHVKGKRYNKFINAAAKEHQIDPALLRAVINVESNFNARARSRVGARGLMQLMPATARDMGVRRARRLYDAQSNIRAGAAYLSKLAERFGEMNADLIIAAYNAGPGAVSKWGGIPPFPETQEYVRRVAALWGKPAGVTLEVSG